MMTRVKVVVLLLCTFAATLSAAAQDAPSVEVFGGYSFVRINEGAPGNSFTIDRGWAASIAPNLNNWFGITADFSGHYDTVGGAKTRFHVLTAGPRFSFRISDALHPSAHLTVGVAHLQTESGTLRRSANSFASVAGGALDVHLGERLSLRVAQVDYVLTRYSGRFQHNLRYSVGVVFRFGSTESP